MKTLFATVAAVAALTAVAAPAAAQPYNGGYDHGRYDRADDRGHGGYQQINQRQARIAQQIDRGVRRGTLTHREASRLSAELRDIERIEARARHGGLSWQERASLDRRLDRLEARLQHERRDDDYARRR